MRVLVSLVLSLLTVAVCHGQDACELNQEALMKMGMECLSHDPSLMLQIIEHMEHPDQMANMKFVCSNQEALVDVAMCMEKKLLVCLPKAVRPIALSLVVRERLEAALGFACKHQAELLDECMDETDTMEFSQCLTEEAQTLIGSLGLASPRFHIGGAQDFLCRYSSAFKKCLAAHSGRCPQTYVDVYDEMFEMILPEHHCDKKGRGEMKNGLATKLLGSLLMHGQPLLGGKAGSLGPVYNMGQD